VTPDAESVFQQARQMLDPARVDRAVTVLVLRGEPVGDAQAIVTKVLAADLIATARDLSSTALEGASL
jgi:hypothetical protein